MRVDRWRVMIVVTREPTRTPQLATAEAVGIPPWDVAVLAAQLLKLGAEVRVVDQNAEQLAHRLVRREMKLWRADLVLLHAGGSHVAANPIPDGRPLGALLAGWSWPAPILACGPLAERYGEELLKTLPRLDGVLVGPVPPALAQGYEPTMPGIGTLKDGKLVEPVRSEEPLPKVLPAWQLLPLDSYAETSPNGQRAAVIGPLTDDIDQSLAEVRHAVRRAGARYLVFDDRDLGADPERSSRLARKMFGAAPGIPWTCRLRADRAEPAFVLTLARGGCVEVLVVPPVPHDVSAQTPMDDPARPRFEGAVEAVRVTGMNAAVLHVVGRPGQSRAMLSAWQRWFRDRRILVRPEVLLQHAGDRGPGLPTLAESRKQAGCWDNGLSPQDVERAVKMLTAPTQPVSSGA